MKGETRVGRGSSCNHCLSPHLPSIPHPPSLRTRITYLGKQSSGSFANCSEMRPQFLVESTREYLGAEDVCVAVGGGAHQKSRG